MPSTEVQTPFVVGPGDVTDAEVEAVFDGAVVAAAPVGTFELTGPGVVACVQGLVTADIEQPGEDRLSYGATLTPKGMIISDLWIERTGGRVILTVPDHGRDRVTEVLTRFVPPRLAKCADRTADLTVLRLAGPEAIDVADRAGLGPPEPTRVGRAIAGSGAIRMARTSYNEPFALQITLPRADEAALVDRLVSGGAHRGSPAALEVARVLAGWPRLDSETDDKTLPQEVRFDEIGGVSYTKGCYTGQETVARVHFRGHPNRELAGIVWQGTPDPRDPSIVQDDRPRGRVTSMVWIPQQETWIGLGSIRRGTDQQRLVEAAGASAELVLLPFDPLL